MPFPRPLPSPAARRAWEAWGGDHRAPGRGAVAVTAGSAGAGAARRGSGRRCGRRAGLGRAARGGSFLAGKGAIVCSYSWYSGGLELPAAPGEGRRPGGRGREGCGRGGASPRGGAAVQAGSASGSLARARVPGCPWHPRAQTG